MNDDVLKQEVIDLFQSAPVLLSTGKKPMSVEVAPAVDLPQQKLDYSVADTAAFRANTYSPSTGTVFQDVNTGAPAEGTLKQDSKKPYLGASLIPGQDVSAKLRPTDGSEGNPFYLQATQRFIPVKPYTIHLDSINKDFMVETKDPVKIAYDIARLYQGVPEDRFMGYKYVPPYMGESYSSVLSKAGGVAWETAKQYSAIALGAASKAAGRTMIGIDQLATGKAGKTLVDELIATNAEMNKPKPQSLVDLAQDADNYDTLRALNLKNFENKLGTYITTNALESRGQMNYPDAGALGRAGVDAWNFGENVAADATQNKQVRMATDLALLEPDKWTHRLTYAAGEFIPMAAAAGAATFIGGPLAGAAVGGALAGAGANERVRRSLLNKGFTYKQASDRGYAAGVVDGVTTAALGAVGGAVGNAAARAWRLGPMMTSVSALGAETATDAILGMPQTIMANRIEEYLAENIGASELLDPVDAQELDAAIMNLVFGVGMGTGSARRRYVERRSQLNTLKAREEFDAQVSPEFKTVVETGKIYRDEILKKRFGMSDVDADNGMMAFIKNGPEFVQEYIRARFEEIGGKYEADPKAVHARIQQATGVSNIDNILASQFRALDDRISYILDAPGNITDMEKKVYRAVMRSHAAEWALATNMPVSRYPLPEYVHGKLRKGTYGETRMTPMKADAPTKVTVDAAQISFKPMNDTHFKALPIQEKYAGLASVSAHELTHDVFDVGTKFYKPDAWAKMYDRIVSSVQSAFQNPPKLPSAEQARTAWNETKRVGYTSKNNATEWYAQAVQVLQKDAKKALGITDSEAWAAISQVHSLLADVNQSVPLAQATQNFVAAFDSVVKKNSDALLRTAERVGADKMRTAIESLMAGNDNAVAWNGVTFKDIADFADAIKGPLNSDAIDMANAILRDINPDDLQKETERLWDEAFAEEDTRIQDAKTVGFADEIDPMEFLAEVLGTGKPKEQAGDGHVTETERALSALDRARVDAEEKATPFERQITKEVGGRTLDQDFDYALKVAGETKTQRGAGAVLSERRGLEGYMFSIGGKRLAKAFDFGVKRQRYTDMFDEKMNSFTRSFIDKRLGGSMNKYISFMRDFESKTIDVTINNPRNDFASETIKVSPSEIANAKFQLDQASNLGPERVKKTWGDTDVEALYKSLTDDQRAFAESMRDDLKSEAKSELQKLGAAGKIRENYWPFISHEAVTDDSPLRSFAFMARHGSTSPVGIVGVSEVFGRYQARLAGAKSEYFSSINRLKDMLDYKMPDGTKFSSDDQAIANVLTDKSAEFKKQVIDKVGTNGLSQIMAYIDDVQNGSIVHEIANSPWMKLTRNLTPKILGFKPRQVATGAMNFALWFGAPDVKNTWGYYADIVSSIANMKSAWDNYMRMGDGFFKHRLQNQSYTEFTKRSATPSEDMLLEDAARFFKKKDMGTLAGMTSAGVYLATLANKAGMAFTVIGDFLGNFAGADALQRTYYKQYIDAGMSPAEATKAADNDVIRYVLYRQSSSNQAMKPLTVRRWNKTNALMAGFGQFTGEPTMKGGQIGQNWQGYKMGEIGFGDMMKDTAFILASQLGYVALASGALAYAGKKALGKDISDDERDALYGNIATNTIDSLIGLGAGPYSSIVSPFVQSVFTNHNYGLSAPIATELEKTIKSAKNIGKSVFTEEELETGDIVTVLGLGFAASGVFPAFENIVNVGRGAYLATSDDEQEATKGRAMLAGRTERYAEKKAGIKKKRTRAKKSSGNSGIIR